MTTKRCKIHYRKLDREDGNFPPISLAKAITSGFEWRSPSGETVRARVRNRISSVPQNSGYQRFLNNFHQEENLAFGTVCLFSPGDMQALLELENEDEHASLDDVLKAWAIAEQRAPEGMEYLHGITYWTAIDDHFYQIQHTSLPTKAIEEYFTWLLRDKTGILAPNQYVLLKAEFDREQVGTNLGDVKAIEVGGLVPETMRDSEISTPPSASRVIEIDKLESIGDKVAKTFQSARKILVDLFGEVETQKIIDSTPPEAALEVKVSIGYRARRRKLQKEFMNNLASGLRDLPDGQIRVRGRDGEIKGDDARLSADMTIRRHRPSSSLLDLEDVLRQFKEVHRRFLHDGRIQS